MQSATRPSAMLGFIPIIVIALLLGAYLSFTLTGIGTTDTSSTTNITVDGVVAGYVTVGPSQPVCYANQSCNVDMSGYSLLFSRPCSGLNCQAETFAAVLSPSGHYSILLAPGTYSVIGLHPSCNWMGCSSAFPKTVVVQSGMQSVFNIDIDTGIR